MSHSIKNAPRRSALRRKRSTSLKRPAAGGESCEQDSFSEDVYKRQEYEKISGKTVELKPGEILAFQENGGKGNISLNLSLIHIWAFKSNEIPGRIY